MLDRDLAVAAQETCEPDTPFGPRLHAQVSAALRELRGLAVRIERAAMLLLREEEPADVDRDGRFGERVAEEASLLAAPRLQPQRFVFSPVRRQRGCEAP